MSIEKHDKMKCTHGIKKDTEHSRRFECNKAMCVISIVLVVSIGLTCCTKEEKDQPSQNVRTENGSETAASIDWSDVPNVDFRNVGFPALMRLLRHVDAWHQGRHDVIIVTVSHNAILSDGQGNELVLDLDAWKSIVSATRRSVDTYGHLQACALPLDAMQYNDNLGDVPQFIYLVEVLDDACIRLQCLRPY